GDAFESPLIRERELRPSAVVGETRHLLFGRFRALADRQHRSAKREGNSHSEPSPFRRLHRAPPKPLARNNTVFAVARPVRRLAGGGTPFLVGMRAGML